MLTEIIVSPLSFLKTIVPETGVFCLNTIKDKVPHQTYYDSIDLAKDTIMTAMNNGRDVYYAMASFTNNGSRKQDNVALVKSYWIDLDCGGDAHYQTLEDGLDAIHRFIENTKLPKPSIVCSGYGYHIYWALTTPVTRDLWDINTVRLIALADEAGLQIKDPGCSTDIARILRVPNTINFKNQEQKKTFIVQLGDQTHFEQFTELVDEACDSHNVITSVIVPRRPVKMDAVTMALLGNSTSNFKKILDKGDNGCKHLLQIVTEQDKVSEPEWRAMLSIAHLCEDRDKAIHNASKQHPSYSREETEEKSNQTLGPYTCATFEKTCGSCEGCPNKGVITSPIQLGKVIKTSLANILEMPKINKVIFDEDGSVTVEKVSAQLEIPAIIWPYVRGINGGIYKQGDKAVGDKPAGEDMMIYDYDLYISKRLYDVEYGECFLCHLHLPLDGMREFVLPLKTLMAGDKLRDTLSSHGVAAGKTRMELIMGYLIQSARELQRKFAADIARLQFGWCDNDSSFIIGTREIRDDATRYSPASSTTANIVPFYGVKGTLEEWKIPFKIYERPGYELHAFVVSSGLGSVLLKFVNPKIKGITINMVNSDSGTGKSTTLEMINSFWGHPIDSMLLAKDSIASILHRTGVLCNIPVTVDEVSNMKPVELSDWLYTHSQGRGRNRMQGSANLERNNSATWSSIMVMTSNSSISDKTRVAKMANEAENVRMLEFTIRLPGDMTAAESIDIFSKTNQNYGIAGEMFARYVVGNKDKVMQLIDHVRIEVEETMQPASSERIWAAAIIANITAMHIAKAINLFDFDTTRVMNEVYKSLNVIRKEIIANRFSSKDVLATYVNENIGNIIIASASEADLISSPIIKDTRMKVVGRYEVKSNTMYIARKEFVAYCVANSLSVKELEHNFELDPTCYKGTKKARLLSGTGIQMDGVLCYQFTMRLDASVIAHGAK